MSNQEADTTDTPTLEQPRVEATKKVSSGSDEWMEVVRRGAKEINPPLQYCVPEKVAAEQQQKQDVLSKGAAKSADKQ